MIPAVIMLIIIYYIYKKINEYHISPYYNDVLRVAREKGMTSLLIGVKDYSCRTGNQICIHTCWYEGKYIEYFYDFRVNKVTEAYTLPDHQPIYFKGKDIGNGKYFNGMEMSYDEWKREFNQ